jgi:uncharacterized membrane protein
MVKLFSVMNENLRKKLPEIIITSVTLIAGMAWNDAFNTLINHYNPTEKTAGSYIYKFIYAVAMTIFMVIMVSIILTLAAYFDGS